MVCANRLFTIKFYNTNTCIVRLTNCVSVPFYTKRQAMRQQPLKRSQPAILVRLFSSNINFNGVYLRQDIIMRPSIAISLLFLFHFTRVPIDMGKGVVSPLEVDRDTLIEQSITLIEQSRFYKCCIL